MKALILFGSTSDQPVYQVLEKKLGQIGVETDLRIISAHRKHKLLAQTLENETFDFVIAGAGLAAHLPGVVASQVECPVFGIPVKGCLNGLDALLSIVQMPAGIPVLCGGIDQIEAHILFIENWNKCDLKSINIVVAAGPESPVLEKEKERILELAKQTNISFELCHAPQSNGVNIFAIENEELLNSFLAQDEILKIGVWLKNAEQIHHPQCLDDLIRSTTRGGLWVGINNLRNAYLAGVQLLGKEGQYQKTLKEIKQGV